MCQVGLDIFNWVVFTGFRSEVLLIVFIEIDKIGVVTPLPHGAVSGEMPLLSALEASSIGIAARWSLCGCCPSSSDSSAATAPSGCTSVVYVHWDRLIVHPLWGVGRVVLSLLLLLLSSSLLVIVPIVSSVVAAAASSIVLAEEWAIRCISSSRWRCVRRRISSASIAACSSLGSLSQDNCIKEYEGLGGFEGLLFSCVIFHGIGVAGEAHATIYTSKRTHKSNRACPKA